MNLPGRARVYKIAGQRSDEVVRRVPKTLHELLAAHERIIIIQTLQRHQFSRTRAAESLGVSRNYLWRRMKILGVDFSALPRTTPGRPRRRTV